MLLGFSEGYVVIISTHEKEMGEELFSSGKLLREALCDVAVSSRAGRAACAGGSSIRLIDTQSWRELRGEQAAVDPALGAIDRLAWSSDGQVLSASTRSGAVVSFLARLRPLLASSGSRLAYASSLKELQVCDAADVAAEAAASAAAASAAASSAAAAGAGGGGSSSSGEEPLLLAQRAAASGSAAAPAAPLLPAWPRRSLTVPLPIEPAFVGVGPRHVAAGSNSRVWFFRALVGITGVPVPVVALGERDYPGTVEAVLLSATTAVVLCSGRLFIHAIEPSAGSAGSGSMRQLPEEGSGSVAQVCCACLGGELLFYGTSSGSVQAFSLRDGAVLPNCCLRLEGADCGGALAPEDVAAGAGLGGSGGGSGSCSIRGLSSNSLGSRLLVLDSLGRLLLFNPVDVRALLVPLPSPLLLPAPCPGSCPLLLWDSSERHLFGVVVGAGGGGGGGSGAAAAAGEAASSGGGLLLFLHAPVTLNGPTVTQLGLSEIGPAGELSILPLAQGFCAGAAPAGLREGWLLAHAPGSGMNSSVLCSHDALVGPRSASPSSAGAGGAGGAGSAARPSQAALRSAFAQNLSLHKLGAAGHCASALGEQGAWRALAGVAMDCLDNAVAMRCYRALGDAGMVLCLAAGAAGWEDSSAVRANMALLFSDFDSAQDLFLASPCPTAALRMRMDLLQWDTALALAESLQPSAKPAISCELAKQREGKGEYAEALALYSAAGAGGAGAGAGAGAPPGRLRRAIAAGIARCTLRLGDVRKGSSLALASGDAALCRDCGMICEGLRQPLEAAALFKAAGLWDRAAQLLLGAKALGSGPAAAALLARCSSPKLLGAAARSLEEAGDWEGAAGAYERARDIDAVVRLLVERLGAADRAGAIVRASRSAAGAAVLARHAVGKGDFRAAIEFLLLARRRDDAFALAAQHAEMDIYVAALRAAVAARSGGGGGAADAASTAAAAASKAQALAPAAASAAAAAAAGAALPLSECDRVGRYYESAGAPLSAVRMYCSCGLWERAMSLLLAGAGSGSALSPELKAQCMTEAIACAGSARSELLTAKLLAFLSGESDGQPKDPRHIFSLYMALGNFSSAAKTALIISRGEQESSSGSFKTAHGLLYEAHAALTSAGARVPQELSRSLVLLHSYLLVKRLIGAGEAEGAARMLVRVVKNISRFPAHAANLLQSAVIQCQRGGLKRSAWEFACALMKPEFREGGALKEEFRKKIEAMVRRPTAEEDSPEPMSACPFCDAAVSAYCLSCEACKSELPFCIVTGKHMALADCSRCPSCSFPAFYTPLSVFAAAGDYSCPMCSAPVAPSAVALCRDPLPFLRKAGGLDTEGV
jgi:WD repeat-containing protein 19